MTLQSVPSDDGDTKIPRVPRGIGSAGRKLWRAVLVDYDLDAQGLELLGQACRTVDQIAALEAVSAVEGVMSSSSQGPRVHPAITEARAQRALLARLIGSLGLDFEEADDPATVKAARSAQARSAARARWGSASPWTTA